jgi:hypothetical protein
VTKIFKAPDGYEPPVIEGDDYKMRPDGSSPWAEKEAEYIARLKAAAQALNGNGDLIGEVIRFPRADGYAQYMVWSEKPLQLIWLELGDAWDIDKITERGLRLSDVRAMVERDRRLDELFGRNKEANKA